MTQKKLRDIAQSAVKFALKSGADDARVRAVSGRSVSLTYRNGKPERIKESAQHQLNVFLYVDGKYTSCGTNHLEKEAVEDFIERSIVLTRAVQADPARKITDPALYPKGEPPELSLEDSAVFQLTPEKRHQYASEIDQAVRDLAPKEIFVSAEAKYQDATEELYQVHSNGFEGSHKETQIWTSAEISLQDQDDRKPSGGAVAGGHGPHKLEKAEEIAQKAIDVAKTKLKSQKIDTAELPMVVENRTVGRLFRYLQGGLSARAIQQRSSFLEGKINEKIGSDKLHVIDDPNLEDGLGSRLFDGEGIAAAPLPIFEEGVLKNYYIDTYYGRKLGISPTTGSSSNVILRTGEKNLDELIKDIDKGVLVRGFLGGSSNPTTGDFSLGVYGTLIEKGALSHAVSEMNIAGNHLELWKRLIDVGSDVYPYSSLLTPSLLFESVQFSGS